MWKSTGKEVDRADRSVRRNQKAFLRSPTTRGTQRVSYTTPNCLWRLCAGFALPVICSQSVRIMITMIIQQYNSN